MEDTELAQEIRAIKHEFMAFRNGIVSDTLRKAGMDCTATQKSWQKRSGLTEA